MREDFCKTLILWFTCGCTRPTLWASHSWGTELVRDYDGQDMIKLITYLTTCITFGMSRPLAATAVATRIGVLPVLKSSKAWENSSQETVYREGANPPNSHHLLSLTLKSVSMDAGRWKALQLNDKKRCKVSRKHLLAQAEAKEVRLPLGLYEDQRPLLGISPILVENANKLVLLLIL